MSCSARSTASDQFSSVISSFPSRSSYSSLQEPFVKEVNTALSSSIVLSMLMSSYSLNEPVPRNIILDFNLETHQPCLTALFWEKVLFPFGVDQSDLGHCTA